MRSVIFLFLLAFAAPAFALDLEMIKPMAGNWLVAPENGEQGCVVSLGTEEAIGGYAITEQKPCNPKSPLHERLYSWNFSEGGIILLDAERKVVLRLEEQEGGPYRTAADVKPGFLMAKGLTRIDRVPMAPQFFGPWNLYNKVGAKICGIDMSAQPPQGGEESFALTLSSDCDAKIRKIKLASWRIEGFDLMLYGTDGEAIDLAPENMGKFTSEDGLSLRR